MVTVIELAEDHFASGGLQHAGDSNIDRFGNHALGVIYHHHSTVIEVRHALVVFLALFEDEDAHGLAGEHDGLEGVGERVDIQNFDSVQLGDFVQIEIIGDDFAIVNFGQLDQFHVDFADVREVVLDDLHVEVRHFLDALQNIETAAAAIAFHGVGGIGDQLQFAQHELRDDEHAIEKTGFGDVGDAAVDDDAGIEDLKGFLWPFFPTENAAQGGKVQQIAFVGADDQPDIGHPQQEEKLQKM